MQSPGIGRALAIQKFETALRCCKPRFVPFHIVIESCEHPGRPALKPDAFVIVHHIPLAIQASDDATVLGVHPVLQPEGNDVVEKRPFVCRPKCRFVV